MPTASFTNRQDSLKKKILSFSLCSLILLILIIFLDKPFSQIAAVLLGLNLSAAAVHVYRYAGETEMLLAWLSKPSEQLPELKTKSLRELSLGIEASIRRIEDEYSDKMLDKQFRLNALQSQINPHFLYNTLECIRSEALIQHNQEIANMAQSLARFFRYSISQRDTIVTIQDELNNIRNYIAIQEFRFEHRFYFHIEAENDDELMECLVPKMIIQPIVENAIFHGLEPKFGKGEIKIIIRDTDDIMLMMITDNGVGMSPDQLKQLREAIQKPNLMQNDLDSGHGNGIALPNVNQRIRLTFGAPYGMEIYSTVNEGTEVQIKFPKVHNRTELEKAIKSVK